MYVVKIDREIFAMLNLESFHFEAREMRTWGFWGPSNFPKKKQKKVSTVPPKNHIPANPLPFLDKGTHWSFQQSLSRPWWCPFFRILASLKKGWGRLLVTKRTRRIRLANQKKRHKASRLDLNLCYIFSKQPKKNTAPTSQNLQVLNCGKDILVHLPKKKTTAWIFQQKFLQNWWAQQRAQVLQGSPPSHPAIRTRLLGWESEQWKRGPLVGGYQLGRMKYGWWKKSG